MTILKVGDICKCHSNPRFLYEILAVMRNEVKTRAVASIGSDRSYIMPKSFIHTASPDFFTPIKMTKLSRIIWGIDEK